MPAFERVLAWHRSYWHSPVSPKPLAATRIAVAAALLADQVLQYLPNLEFLYGPTGVAPAGTFDDLARSSWQWPALLFSSDDPLTVAGLFAFWVASTVALLLGWHTRVSAVLVWVLSNGFILRNPVVANGGDDVLRIALFLLVISPSGAVWSLDRRRSPAVTRIAPWSLRLFQLQLCVIYLTTGIHKALGEMWRDGTAMHYVLNDITTVRFSFAEVPWPLWVTMPMTYGALAFELSFVVLVAWSRTRRATLLAGMAFHLAIVAVLEVGWFSFYMIAMYAPWFSASRLDAVSATVQRLRGRDAGAPVREEAPAT